MGRRTSRHPKRGSRSVRNGGRQPRSPEELRVTALRVAKLDKEAVLVGGYALQAYGSRRLTSDLDVLVREEPEAVEVKRQLSFGGVRTEVAGVAVDFIVRSDEAQHLYEAARISAVRMAGYPLRIARLEYLLAMKLYAGRAKDHADIETMAGWEGLDREAAFDIARRYLGIMAVKDLKQLLAIADWKREQNIDDEE